MAECEAATWRWQRFDCGNVRRLKEEVGGVAKYTTKGVLKSSGSTFPGMSKERLPERGWIVKILYMYCKYQSKSSPCISSREARLTFMVTSEAHGRNLKAEGDFRE